MEKKSLFGQFRIRNRSIAAVVLLFIVMVVIGVCGMYYTLLDSARVLGRDLVRSYVQDEELSIARFQNQVSLGMLYLEEMEEMGVGEEEKESWVRDYFNKVEEALPEREVDVYALLNGRLIAENPWDGIEEYDYTQSEWYQKAAAADGGVIFTNAYIGQNRDGWVVSVAAVNLESGDGIILDLYKDTFQVFHENQSLPEDGAYYLCDANGQLLYSNTHFQVTEEQLEVFARDLSGKVARGEVTEQDNEILGVNGEMRGVYFSYVHDGWFCAMTMTYAALLKGMRSLFAWYIVVFFLFLLTALLLGFRNRQLFLAVRKEKEITQALGNSYYAFYRVNAENNTYEIVKGSEYINAKLPVHGEYTKLLHMVAGIMDMESGQEFLESFSLEKIKELIEQQTEGFGGDFLRFFGEEYHWINVTLLVDESLGKNAGVLCFRKIQEEKQHQRQYQKLLEDALAAEERSERTQKQFFACMSHEMKTPLNIIIGMVDMAQNTAIGTEKYKDCLKKIKDSARQLADFINDILENSRVDHAFKEKEWQNFDLEGAVLESIGDYSEQAGQEGKELSVDMDIENRMVSGNPSYLVQVLDQLLSNAVKFTHAGDQIRVKVRQTGEGGKQRYNFTVKDTGIGMAEEFLPKLFEPYAAVKRFGQQKSGRGLGLAIVKNLVMQMGGVIHVESELGKGSSFTVTIPFLAVNAVEDAAVGLAGEESTGTAKQKALKLKEAGYKELEPGGTGWKEAGLEELESAGAGFSVTVLESIAVEPMETELEKRQKASVKPLDKESGAGDMAAGNAGRDKRGTHAGDAAGKKDAAEKGKTIGKKDAVKKGNIIEEIEEKDVAGKGNEEEDNVEGGNIAEKKGIAEGEAAAERKGIAEEEVAAEKKDNVEEDTSEEEDGSKLEGYKILVAEDNPLNMEIAVELLQMAGAKVDCAVNGQEAVELFEKSAVGYYDALLFDMRMPVLDGCGAAEAIRKMGRPDAAVVPIAALTANTLAEDVAQTAHAGMNVHMAKPVMAEQLWDTLRELILESQEKGKGNGFI